MSECYTASRIAEAWGSQDWVAKLLEEHLVICAICQANQGEAAQGVETTNHTLDQSTGDRNPNK